MKKIYPFFVSDNLSQSARQLQLSSSILRYFLWPVTRLVVNKCLVTSISNSSCHSKKSEVFLLSLIFFIIHCIWYNDKWIENSSQYCKFGLIENSSQYCKFGLLIIKFFSLNFLLPVILKDYSLNVMTWQWNEISSLYL